MNSDQSHVSSSEGETLEIGRRLGQELSPPRTLLLEGCLGAGKTLLTRGILEGLGLLDSSEVHSPSFSLVNEYHCPSATVFHIDLYRLDTLRDFYSIGLEEILAEEAIVIIEWAEKLPFQVGNPVRIRIEVTPEDYRRIEIFGC